MEKIGIFCSACSDIKNIYFEKTRELGLWMGREGKTLVYGGSDLGLMDCIAQAVHEAGGKVYGVVPMKLEEIGHVSDLLDVSFACVNLSDRKDIMIQESDIMVALPGGVGTLDEIFTVVAANSIGYHDKRIVLYNVDGFWNPLLDILSTMQKQGFMRHDVTHYVEVANSFEQLTSIINQ